MNTDPSWWHTAGVADRNAGNTIPGVTIEDFNREIADAAIARACAEAYRDGFEGRTIAVGAAYEPTDPKSEGYHDRVSALWDSRDGK